MRQVITVLLAGLVLAGCAARPELPPRPGGNPLGVDLSGQWVLRGEDPQQVDGEQLIRIPRSVGRTSEPGNPLPERRSRTRRSAVHVFLESGKSLKVTQTDYGLFFSFDRAIVEEYNFGENRDVSVGPIEARRVSGWEGRSFVVETMDEKGNVLAESWQLDEGGLSLVRDLQIIEKGELAWSSQQVFDRE